MRRHGLLLLAICLCHSGAGCGARGPRDETADAPAGTPEAAAKAISREFITGLRGGKKAAVLAACDAPYFDLHTFAVIDTREELERAYDGVLKPWARAKPLPNVITGITRYRDLRPALTPPVRKLFDRVIGEDDCVVTLGDGPDDERHLLVRVRDGVAKVVGVTTR